MESRPRPDRPALTPRRAKASASPATRPSSAPHDTSRKRSDAGVTPGAGSDIATAAQAGPPPRRRRLFPRSSGVASCACTTSLSVSSSRPSRDAGTRAIQDQNIGDGVCAILQHQMPPHPDTAARAHAAAVGGGRPDISPRRRGRAFPRPARSARARVCRVAKRFPQEPPRSGGRVRSEYPPQNHRSRHGPELWDTELGTHAQSRRRLGRFGLSLEQTPSSGGVITPRMTGRRVAAMTHGMPRCSGWCTAVFVSATPAIQNGESSSSMTFSLQPSATGPSPVMGENDDRPANVQAAHDC